MADIIDFYSTRGVYGCFSNFSKHPVKIYDRVWRTTEHFYQAMKMTDPKDRDAIFNTSSPREAADMGRDPNRSMRKDWDSVKDDVMRIAITEKVQQHPEVRAILLSTGSALIREHTSNDRYWGDGGDGTGRNMLGQILMEVRAEEQGIDDSNARYQKLVDLEDNPTPE